MIKDALDTLGEKIGPGQERDAVHVAVLPIEASQRLLPGARVGVVGGKASLSAKTFVGIVDPFLKEAVKEGEYFWLMLYPRTITSLRHVWEHPDIQEAPGLEPVDQKAVSEQWLRDFIAHSDCPSYEIVIGKALSNYAAWDPEYLHFDGLDAHGEIPDEFWDHLEIVTGETVQKEDRAKYFSCSC